MATLSHSLAGASRWATEPVPKHSRRRVRHHHLTTTPDTDLTGCCQCGRTLAHDGHQRAPRASAHRSSHVAWTNRRVLTPATQQRADRRVNPPVATGCRWFTPPRLATFTERELGVVDPGARGLLIPDAARRANRSACGHQFADQSLAKRLRNGGVAATPATPVDREKCVRRWLVVSSRLRHALDECTGSTSGELANHQSRVSLTGQTAPHAPADIVHQGTYLASEDRGHF